MGGDPGITTLAGEGVNTAMDKRLPVCLLYLLWEYQKYKRQGSHDPCPSLVRRVMLEQDRPGEFHSSMGVCLLASLALVQHFLFMTLPRLSFKGAVLSLSGDGGLVWLAAHGMTKLKKESLCHSVFLLTV